MIRHAPGRGRPIAPGRTVAAGPPRGDSGEGNGQFVIFFLLSWSFIFALRCRFSQFSDISGVSPELDRPVFPEGFFVRRRPGGADAVSTYIHVMFYGPGVKPKISPGANPASIPARPPGRGHGPGHTGLHPRRRRPTFRAAVRASFVFRPRPGPPQTGGAPAAGDSGAGRLRRGAGVVERGGLENRCALCVPWVRIPPSPPEALQAVEIISYPRFSSRIAALASSGKPPGPPSGLPDAPCLRRYCRSGRPRKAGACRSPVPPRRVFRSLAGYRAVIRASRRRPGPARRGVRPPIYWPGAAEKTC